MKGRKTSVMIDPASLRAMQNHSETTGQAMVETINEALCMLDYLGSMSFRRISLPDGRIGITMETSSNVILYVKTEFGFVGIAVMDKDQFRRTQLDGSVSILE